MQDRQNLKLGYLGGVNAKKRNGGVIFIYYSKYTTCESTVYDTVTKKKFGFKKIYPLLYTS